MFQFIERVLCLDDFPLDPKLGPWTQSFSPTVGLRQSDPTYGHHLLECPRICTRNVKRNLHIKKVIIARVANKRDDPTSEGLPSLS